MEANKAAFAGEAARVAHLHQQLDGRVLGEPRPDPQPRMANPHPGNTRLDAVLLDPWRGLSHDDLGTNQ
jgi:hypothetical protein